MSHAAGQSLVLRLPPSCCSNNILPQALLCPGMASPGQSCMRSRSSCRMCWQPRALAPTSAAAAWSLAAGRRLLAARGPGPTARQSSWVGDLVCDNHLRNDENVFGVIRCR